LKNKNRRNIPRPKPAFGGFKKMSMKIQLKANLLLLTSFFLIILVFGGFVYYYQWDYGDWGWINTITQYKKRTPVIKKKKVT
jgi:hypothetical protein